MSDARQAAEQHLLELQRRLMATQLARRKTTPQPQDWAYTFAGNARGFLGELIGPDWLTPEWLAWRTFISVVFAQPLQGSDELDLFRQCTGLQDPPQTRPASVWMPVGRRGGKALALDTPIPTPFGWTTMGELGDGDLVYDERGQSCRVRYAHAVQLDRPCYRVRFSDGSALVADAEHLWTTWDRQVRKALGRPSTEARRTPRTITTAELARTLYVDRSDGLFELNHAIPCCRPLVGAPQDLPIPPYLLGYWLANGHTDAAAISSPDPEPVAAFEHAGYRLAPSPSTAEHTAPTYYITAIDAKWDREQSFHVKLRLLGVLGNKHIPPGYLRLPIADRIALLQGLMDGDGHCDTRGHAEYCSINLRLAHDVRELVLSLGFKAGLSDEIARLNGREIGPKYRVTFIAYADFPVFRVARKAQNQRPAGRHAVQTKRRFVQSVEPVPSVPVRCITVDSPSELYLAGETMIPTHNSRMLAAIAVHLATCYDWSHYLDPGELGVLPVLAQDRRSARTIMGYVKAFLEHPKLAPLVEGENAESLRLRGNLLIEVVTASYRAVRNRTVIAALLDELAFWSNSEDSANPDHEIIAALEPAMATIPNALLLGASSPYARRGVLWDQYEKHYGKPGGPLVWKAATRTMNPSVPPEFIAQKYEEDPLAAAAEYGAEFRSDVDAFITREVLDRAVAHNRYELPYSLALSYRAFVDPSGGSSDAMTLAIAHIDRTPRAPGTGACAVLDVLRERRPPFSPDSVVAEFAMLLREYRVPRVVGDAYAGEWPRESFRRVGIDYQVSTRRKSDIYLEFLPLLNACRVELLDERTLYQQLLSLERRIARGGHESIDHPPGGHDDLANVAAGVMVELLARRDMLGIDPSVVQRSAMIRTRRILDPEPPGMGSGPRW